MHLPLPARLPFVPYTTLFRSGATVSTENLDRPSPDPSRPPVPSVSAEITSMSIVDVGGGSGSTGSPREDRRAPKGAVYRILPRSEERRVGKEGRSRWAPTPLK